MWTLNLLNEFKGMWEKAELPCLESLRLRQQLFGEHNLVVAKCLCGLGGIYFILFLFCIFQTFMRRQKWQKKELGFSITCRGRGSIYPPIIL
jgi:hypothetical protein